MDPNVNELKETNIMTLKYMYRDAHNLQPSLLEVLLGFIQESIEDEESGIEVKKLMTKYPTNTEATHPQQEPAPKRRKTTDNTFRSSKQSDQDRLRSRPPSVQSDEDIPNNAESEKGVIVNPSTTTTELRTKAEETRLSIEYNEEDLLVDYSLAYTRIIRCKAKQFSSILEPNIDPEESIVAKIFLEDEGRFFSTTETAMELYRTERECIKRLTTDNEYHNCYLQHSEAHVVAEER